MNAYRIGIILGFLSVVCVCDNNESITATSDSKNREIEEHSHNDLDQCHEPGNLGHKCSNCCKEAHLTCYENICTKCTNEEGFYVCGSTAYETASQISLSIAMALGIIILLVVLWKMCLYDKMSPFRRYSRRARARMIANGSTPRSDDITRASSSSIQIRIVARLQNRPPRYETAYNYNQRVEAAKETAIVDEAPPAYDAVEENVEKGPPPPYMIHFDANITQGISNNSFVVDEPTSRSTDVTNVNMISNIGVNATNAVGNNRNATRIDETIHL